MNPVTLSFAQAVLKDAGIESFLFDMNSAVLDGSTILVRKRLMIIDEEEAEARELLEAAGIGHELEPAYTQLMKCILTTNNPATLNFAEAILKEAKIDYFVLDQNMNVLEPGIMIPRRLMVSLVLINSCRYEWLLPIYKIINHYVSITCHS